MRKLEYVGRGQIVDAATKNLVSPQRIVFEYNLLAEAVANASPKPFVWPRDEWAAPAKAASGKRADGRP